MVYTYDVLGEQLTETGYDGAVTTTAVLGRTREVTDGNGRHFIYESGYLPETSVNVRLYLAFAERAKAEVIHNRPSMLDDSLPALLVFGDGRAGNIQLHGHIG
ncbi:MAG: hypothetical protein R3C43_19790 [Chloroflexota bacterium]